MLNREKKTVRRKKKRPLFLWILTVVTACAAGFGTMYYEVYAKKRRESYQRVYETLSLTFADQTPEVFEYSPGTIDLLSYAAESNGEVSVEPKSVDLTKLQTTEAVYRVSRRDEYDQLVTKEFPRTFRVIDSYPPEIDLVQTITLSPGEPFDPLQYIRSVRDPVDGDLPYAETKPENGKTGWYTVSHNADPSVIGSYAMTVTACDRNGNIAEASADIIVAEHLREQVMASWQFSDHWYDAEDLGMIGIDIENGQSTERFGSEAEARNAYNELPKAILNEKCEAYRGQWYTCSGCSVLSDRYYLVRGVDEQGRVHYYRIVYSYDTHEDGYVDPSTGRWSFTSWFLD